MSVDVTDDAGGPAGQPRDTRKGHAEIPGFKRIVDDQRRGAVRVDGLVQCHPPSAVGIARSREAEVTLGHLREGREAAGSDRGVRCPSKLSTHF